MDRIRVGIVGVGNIGSAHLSWICAHPEAGLTVAALCDSDPQRREVLRERWPDIPLFADSTVLMRSGRVDAVIVATPHYDHPEIAIEGFRHDLHVLIEKPAGVYTGRVRQMNEEARRSGKVFGIMFNQRTNPLFARTREIVQSGQLGQPKRLVWIVTNWYRTQAYYDSGSWRATWNGEGGGVLLNQAPHNLDLWQWIFGMPRRVYAFCGMGKYHRIGVEDDVTIQAEYASGACATFITSTGEAPGSNRLEISGDRGKLVLEDDKLRWWKLSQPEREFCFSAAEGFFLPDMAYEEFTKPAEAGHPLILRNFADAIRYGTPLIAPGEEGIHSLSLSNAAYLSAWTGDWAEIPVDEEAFVDHLRRHCAQEKQKPSVRQEHLSDGYQTRWNIRW